ncbi:hypothetical protein LJR164_001474 [Phenylobacterium sp. LjRoot164]|uniref:hypothetical protein n=1 Tax=unclassified Phenylobacterium TaxID=2640670 RepID=UPI003ECFC9A2
MPEAARPVAGGRAVQVSVGQAELGSNINSTLGFAMAAGGAVGVLIEAKVGADRAQRAQLGITPIRRDLMDFDADQLAIDTTKVALAGMPWLEGQEPAFTRDATIFSKSDFLTAAPTSQAVYFTYVYDMAPDFSSVNVSVGIAVANKEQAKKGAPYTRLIDKNLVYGQLVSSVVRLAAPTTPVENAQRWAANDSALTKKALALAFGEVGVLIPRALTLTDAEVTRVGAAERKTIGSLSGKPLEESAGGTLLFNPLPTGLIHVQTLQE